MMPRAIAARVAYVPGTGFYADGTGQRHMRLNFSFPPPERIREGVRRLAGVMEQELAMRAVFGPCAHRRRGQAGADVARPRLGMIGACVRLPRARCLVLAGGLSYERDVSLRSGRRVLDALRAVGVDAELRDADVTLLPALAVDPPDAVVIALHGATGEDGSLRGVLDLCGVPYVGCDARASRLAWDKPSAKAVLREAGIPTPDWVALPHDRFSELGAVAVLDRIVDRLGLPLMVKPAQGGSGLGAAVVRDAAALPAAMVGCFAYDRRRWSSGTSPASTSRSPIVDLGEGPRRSAGGRDRAPQRGVRLRGPVHGRPDDLARTGAAGPGGGRVRSRTTALAAHKALGLRDLSRVDLIVDAGRCSRTCSRSTSRRG